MKMFLMGALGMLALQVLLVGGYYAVLERGSEKSPRVVARDLLGAALVAASLMMTLLWLLAPPIFYFNAE
jgi:heme A synthase